MKGTHLIIKVTIIVIASYLQLGDAFMSNRGFSLLAKDRSVNPNKVTNTVVVRSELECGTYCTKDTFCTGFAFTVGFKCLLGQGYPLAADFLTTSDPEYTVYENVCRTKKTIHHGFGQTVSFRNSCDRNVRFIWISYEGEERDGGALILPGQSHLENTFAGHVFIVRDDQTNQQILIGGDCQYVIPTNQINTVEITNTFQ